MQTTLETMSAADDVIQSKPFMVSSDHPELVEGRTIQRNAFEFPRLEEILAHRSTCKLTRRTDVISAKAEIQSYRSW